MILTKLNLSLSLELGRGICLQHLIVCKQKLYTVRCTYVWIRRLKPNNFGVFLYAIRFLIIRNRLHIQKAPQNVYYSRKKFVNTTKICQTDVVIVTVKTQGRRGCQIVIKILSSRNAMLFSCAFCILFKTYSYLKLF